MADSIKIIKGQGEGAKLEVSFLCHDCYDLALASKKFKSGSNLFKIEEVASSLESKLNQSAQSYRSCFQQA